MSKLDPVPETAFRLIVPLLVTVPLPAAIFKSSVLPAKTLIVLFEFTVTTAGATTGAVMSPTVSVSATLDPISRAALPVEAPSVSESMVTGSVSSVTRSFPPVPMVTLKKPLQDCKTPPTVQSTISPLFGVAKAREPLVTQSTAEFHGPVPPFQAELATVDCPNPGAAKDAAAHKATAIIDKLLVC